MEHDAEKLNNDNDDNDNNKDADYEYARSKYYSLAEKGEEAIDIMLEFARESESPRAMEVLSNMLKQNAEITDRLIELHKKKKEIEVLNKSLSSKNDNEGTPSSLTQNNLFIGSTTELQKFLHRNNIIFDHNDNNNNDIIQNGE